MSYRGYLKVNVSSATVYIISVALMCNMHEYVYENNIICDRDTNWYKVCCFFTIGAAFQRKNV